MREGQILGWSALMFAGGCTGAVSLVASVVLRLSAGRAPVAAAEVAATEVADPEVSAAEVAVEAPPVDPAPRWVTAASGLEYAPQTGLRRLDVAAPPEPWLPPWWAVVGAVGCSFVSLGLGAASFTSRARPADEPAPGHRASTAPITQ